MRHMGSLKAYVSDFNVQKNVKSKMDDFLKKCNFLGWLQWWVVDALFNLPKFLEDEAWTIKIA